jgi:hypothetical protein
MRRLADERGQVSVNWAGMAAVVVAVAIALAAGIAPVANYVVGAVKVAICKLEGGSCTLQQVLQQPPPCTVADSTRTVNTSVTAFSVTGGGKLVEIRTLKSDGTVDITLSAGGELGAKLGEGGDVQVGNATEGEGATFKAVVNGELGGTWHFKNQGEANAFTSSVKDYLKHEAISSIPVGGWIYGAVTDAPSIRPPDVVYAQGGAGVTVSGDAGEGPLYADGTAGISGAAGAKYDLAKHETTVYFKLSGTAEGKAGELVGLRGSGGADASAQLSVTFDSHGNPITAAVLVTGGVKGGYQVGLNATDPKALLKNVQLGDTKSGVRLEASDTLDLKDPANRQALQSFLTNPTGGLPGAIDAFSKHGVGQVRLYKTNSDKYGGDLNVGVDGVDFGLGGSYSHDTSELMNAWDYINGLGLEKSVTCH